MAERVHHHPNLIYSAGTQVVALAEVRVEGGRVAHPRGAVGTVLKSPRDLNHAYWIRFLDGLEAPLKPSDVMLLAQYKEGEIGDSTISAARMNLFDRVIYRCVIGSQAYGLAGLDSDGETIEKSGIDDGLEIDLVTHDVKKFFGLMLKKNGYVLEQLLSPLVVYARPEHAELKQIALGCVTRHHAHHYLGFAATQWKLFEKESPPRVKPLLYVYRVLLTGIHLMRTGEVEANLPRLNETAKLPYIADLIDRKIGGTEKQRLERADLDFHRGEYDRLLAELAQASADSRLPEAPRGVEALHEFLIRLRLGGA
jgi:uncharacterized protein